MYDRSLPYVHLEMETPLPANRVRADLPAGYSIRTYEPGDEKYWAAIETTAGEFSREEDALKSFRDYYGNDRDLLPGRMFFVISPEGVPCATATAWFNGRFGHLHWVAVHAEHQGKGLARCVIAGAMDALTELSYDYACLSTQPSSWVAVKLYLEFGFRPVLRDSQAVVTGWQQTYAKLGKEWKEELCVPSLVSGK